MKYRISLHSHKPLCFNRVRYSKAGREELTTKYPSVAAAASLVGLFVDDVTISSVADEYRRAEIKRLRHFIRNLQKIADQPSSRPRLRVARQQLHNLKRIQPE